MGIIVSHNRTVQSSSVSTFTHPYANPIGGDLILITCHSIYYSLSNLAYGGVMPVLLARSDDYYPRVYIFGILKENQPTAGATHDLVATWDGSSYGTTSFTKIANVHADVLSDIESIIKSEQYISGYGVETTIQPAAKSFLFDAVSVYYDAGVTQDVSQTKLYWDVSYDTRADGASWKLTAAGEQEMSWTGAATSGRINHCVIAVKMDKVVTLESGSIALAGDVDLLYNRSMTIDTGSLVVNGSDIDLSVVDYYIKMSSAAAAVAGLDVGLFHNKKIAITPGTFSVVGTDMSLLYGYGMDLESGSLFIAGDVGLLWHKKLSMATGVISLSGAVSFDLTTTEQIRAGTVVYLFSLTGTADGTTDVEIPIKSLQARMRSGSPTYLSVSIPRLSEYEDYVSARTNGTMQIDVAYLLDGEYTFRETIISVTLDDIRVDTGPFNKSITLTGRQQKTYSNKSITLYRPIYKNILNGQHRYRFAEPHVYLFPGDTVNVDDVTFAANVISYYVNARTGGADTRMEIAEGSTY